MFFPEWFRWFVSFRFGSWFWPISQGRAELLVSGARVHPESVWAVGLEDDGYVFAKKGDSFRKKKSRGGTVLFVSTVFFFGKT